MEEASSDGKIFYIFDSNENLVSHKENISDSFD